MGFTVPDKNAARWEKIGFSVNANANLNFYVLFQSLQFVTVVRGELNSCIEHICLMHNYTA